MPRSFLSLLTRLAVSYRAYELIWLGRINQGRKRHEKGACKPNVVPIKKKSRQFGWRLFAQIRDSFKQPSKRLVFCHDRSRRRKPVELVAYADPGLVNVKLVVVEICRGIVRAGEESDR